MLRHDPRAKFQQQEKNTNDTALGCGYLFGLAGAGIRVLVGILLGKEVVDLIGPTIGWGLIGFTVGVIAGIVLVVVTPLQYRLHAGKYESEPIGARRYDEMAQRQNKNPCLIMQADARTWWWFQDEIYWENEGLSALEVKALVLERKRKQQRRIKRAIAVMEQEETGSVREREPIPDDIKIFVWRRDGGKCVKCGSRENLEFDHIIPLSMGGSNTARNIQLLCEACNRAKGSSLF